MEALPRIGVAGPSQDPAILPVVARAARLWLADSELVAYDTETEGLIRVTPDGSVVGTAPGVWELAGLAFRARGPLEAEARTWRIRLGRPLPAEVARISGVDPGVTVVVGRESATVLGEFSGFVAGRVLVAHNGSLFDDPIMRAAYRAAGVPVPPELAHPAWTFDSRPLSRALLPGSHRLGEVAETLGVAGSWSHRAADDATLLARVTIALLELAARAFGALDDPEGALEQVEALDPDPRAGPSHLYGYPIRVCITCGIRELVAADRAARGPRCEPCYRALPRRSGEAGAAATGASADAPE